MPHAVEPMHGFQTKLTDKQFIKVKATETCLQRLPREVFKQKQDLKTKYRRWIRWMTWSDLSLSLYTDSNSHRNPVPSWLHKHSSAMLTSTCHDLLSINTYYTIVNYKSMLCVFCIMLSPVHQFTWPLCRNDKSIIVLMQEGYKFEIKLK